MSPLKPRVVVVDDHMLVAQAVAKVLEADYEVAGTYADPREFLRNVDQLRPDLAVVDLSMPQMHGLDLTRELHARRPETRIIIVTMDEDPELAAEAFRAGASGYVLKRSATGELAFAAREVLSQRYYISPLIAKDLVGSLVHDPHARKPIHQLTARQREVLQLLAEGHSMKSTAAILHVSPRTVAFHKYRMMEHLNVQSTAALIRFAVREKLV